MKVIMALSLSIAAILFSAACNDATTTAGEIAPIPEVFEASYSTEVAKELGSSRFSSRNNVIDELYEEVLEKDPELEKLELQIEGVSNIHEDGTKEYEAYLSNHLRFIHDAKRFLQYMEDSTLEANTLKLLENFHQNFESKAENLAEKSGALDSLVTEILDHQRSLKFMVALSSMTEYEQEYLPKTEPLIEAETKLKEIEKDILEREKLLE